jgi:hypothetical protein
VDAELRAKMCDPSRVRALRCIRPIKVTTDEGTVELRAGNVEDQVAPNWPPLRALSDRELIWHFDPVPHSKGSRTTIQTLPRGA